MTLDPLNDGDDIFFQWFIFLTNSPGTRKAKTMTKMPQNKKTTKLLSSGHLALILDKNWVYNLNRFFCHKLSCSFILNWVYIVLSRFLISDARFRSEIHPVPHPAATGATPPRPGIGKSFFAGCFFPLFFQNVTNF